MDPGKKKRLEAAGWCFGDAGDFLGRAPSEHDADLAAMNQSELAAELQLLREAVRSRSLCPE